MVDTSIRYPEVHMTPKKHWGLRLLGLALVALLVLTARLFVWPPTGAPQQADAVIVLAGGHGERLDAALELMDRGVAQALVISRGDNPGWRRANVLCGQQRPYRVVCETANPDTTLGEARMGARLASEHGWNTLVVVTSTYHTTRASVLLRACHPGPIRAVAAQPDGHPLKTWRLVAREWAALPQALAFDRDC